MYFFSLMKTFWNEILKIKFKSTINFFSFTTANLEATIFYLESNNFLCDRYF